MVRVITDGEYTNETGDELVITGVMSAVNAGGGNLLYQYTPAGGSTIGGGADSTGLEWSNYHFPEGLVMGNGDMINFFDGDNVLAISTALPSRPGNK